VLGCDQIEVVLISIEIKLEVSGEGLDMVLALYSSRASPFHHPPSNQLILTFASLLIIIILWSSLVWHSFAVIKLKGQRHLHLRFLDKLKGRKLGQRACVLGLDVGLGLDLAPEEVLKVEIG
jgi:hypothetical protein